MLLQLARFSSPVIYGGIDSDALLWKAAVVGLGGTVSDARLALVSSLNFALKAAGIWTMLDRLWLLAAENSTAALVDLVTRTAATAVNSPTFTIDRDYTFDGATNYIDMNFTPSVNSTVMTASDLGLWLYERTNINSGGFSGGANTSNPPRVALYIRGNNGGNMAAVANGGGNVAITTSAGFLGTTLSVTTNTAWQNGASLGTPAGEVQGASLPAHSLYIGCFNNAGTASNFSTRSIGVAVAGKGSLSVGQQTSFYNAIQSYMTSVGAQV